MVLLTIVASVNLLMTAYLTLSFKNISVFRLQKKTISKEYKKEIDKINKKYKRGVSEEFPAYHFDLGSEI